MERLVDLEKLNRMDCLIRKASTGTPNELAQHLNMTYGGLLEMVTFLKDVMKAPIAYVSSRPSYVYEYMPKFYLGFEGERTEPGVTSSDKMAHVYGCKESKNKRIKVEVEIDDDDYILDSDLNFNDLYFEA